jgi:hypothetical protein
MAGQLPLARRERDGTDLGRRRGPKDHGRDLPCCRRAQREGHPFHPTHRDEGATQPGRPRIPDIYYFKLNKAHLRKGKGAINEFKVGTEAGTRKDLQAAQDAFMLSNRHGFGANTFNRGEFLPVTTAVWWFAPKDGVTFSNFTFIKSLLARGYRRCLHGGQCQCQGLATQGRQKEEGEGYTKEFESSLTLIL